MKSVKFMIYSLSGVKSQLYILELSNLVVSFVCPYLMYLVLVKTEGESFLQLITCQISYSLVPTEGLFSLLRVKEAKG